MSKLAQTRIISDGIGGHSTVSERCRIGAALAESEGAVGLRSDCGRRGGFNNE